AYTTVKKAIKLETVSEEAACMQVMLKTLGYEPGRTDGYFSKKTLSALKAFLKAEKMSDSQVYNQAICTRLLTAYIKYVKVLDHDPVYKHVISLI
ncbi:MAG: peptidoglycan-binding domain-containing protein, partial [bacterium]